MTETKTKPAPVWRLTVHTIHAPIDEFEEVYETEATAIARVGSIVSAGSVSQHGTDAAGNAWTRVTPLSNILYLEVHKKVG